MRRIVLLSLLPLLLAGSLSAQPLPNQSWQTDSCNGDSGNTHNYSLFGPKVQVCQLRRIVLQPGDQLNVQSQNGGIDVIGQERNTIALEARVIVKAYSRTQAESVQRQITIETQGVIHAKGPHPGLFGPNWYVNYRLYVPQSIATHLKTENGGIDLHHLQGTLQAETVNGGLTLDALSGDVHARTVNGGITVHLSGSSWQGLGLVAQTTNGGIHVKAAPGYSAHLMLQTVNGGISIHSPFAVQDIQHNHFEGNLGHGGATIELHTVNGGISVGGA